MSQNKVSPPRTSVRTSTAAARVTRTTTSTGPDAITSFGESLQALKTIHDSHGNSKVNQHKLILVKCHNVMDIEYKNALNQIKTLKLSKEDDEKRILMQQVNQLKEALNKEKEEKEELKLKVNEVMEENVELKREVDLIKIQIADRIISAVRAAESVGATSPAPLTTPLTTPLTATRHQNQPESAPEPSWADMVKKPGIIPLSALPATNSTNAVKHVVIITPKGPANKPKDGNATREQFNEKIRGKKIRINSKKAISNKRVVVECATQEDCEAIVEELKEDAHLKASLPKKENPIIQLLGIPRTIESEEDLLDTIMSENQLDKVDGLEKSMLTIKYFADDRKLTKFATIQTEPKMFQELKKRRKLYIHTSRCNMAQRACVLQCGRCNRFGHTPKQCDVEVENLLCGRCCGKHLTVECTAEEDSLMCSNCAFENTKNRKLNISETICTKHSATDHIKCPKYKQIQQIVLDQFYD